MASKALKSRKTTTFVVASSRRADFVECRSGYREGALHFVKCLLTLCHLVSLNLGNSITQIKDIAEVDTTGRYRHALPAVCRRLTMPSMHTFWEQCYIPTAWLSESVCYL